jgi:hypothetical protein
VGAGEAGAFEARDREADEDADASDFSAARAEGGPFAEARGLQIATARIVKYRDG